MKTNRKLGTAWTPTDVKKMRELARKRMSARLAAMALGRTPGAVKFAAMVRGIHFRAINQARGVQRRPSLRKKLSRLRRARAA